MGKIKVKLASTRYIHVNDFIPRVWRGNLFLKKRFPEVVKLPEGLEVDGTLDLSGSKVESLPKGLEVRGDLILKNSKITSLPTGLVVGGRLILNRLITAIPDNCTFNSPVYLAKTNIQSIGENCTFNSDLNLLKAKVKHIGSGLKVKGLFTFHKATLKAIPEDIEVNEFLPRGFDISRDMTIPEWLVS